jgi:predicted nucleotidyltransferase
MAMITTAENPILQRLRSALDRLYGDRIERVVLYGSRARGDAGEDSDYDVAVFLRDLTDRWHELDRLADLRSDFLEGAGVFIDAKPYPAGAYRDRTTLMGEIRREGVDL